jgi:metal-dependent hydrolase (beta-lactamase superfamily II)
MYDPCSYPGIQSKFYYNLDKDKQDGICNCSVKCNKKGSGSGDGQCKEISFMVFRTGSVLIVGNCDEHILNIIYQYIKNILEKEYQDITDGLIGTSAKKKCVRKVRKCDIIVDL